MKPLPDIARLQTGVKNLDALLHGGLPAGSVTVVCGPPGSGKTVLSEQICFQNATAERPAVVFNTLSEPTAKSLRYLSQFDFADRTKLEDAVQFTDLGGVLRKEGLARALAAMLAKIKEVKPGLVVVDSFKAFDDLARSPEELRRFGYEVAVNLMAWETTSLLLGEYPPHDYEANPLFSVIDGLIAVSQRESSGEQQRFLQVRKMRGTDHSRDEHPFVISRAGIEIFAPRVLVKRKPVSGPIERCKTGISRLDDLLGEGVPYGSSVLMAGVAGTGKTVLLLELIYRGALAGEPGILFSFEETEGRLMATAEALGWDFARLRAKGLIEIVFIPQPEISVEAHLLMIRERIEAMGARRVAVDSLSVFLHKVRDPNVSREKVFQLATVVANANAVGFFATDIPYGVDQLSRFGVEETVVDGVILLSATEEGFDRRRYLEVYKLRNTAHLAGRHSMVIGKGGVSVFPRYLVDPRHAGGPPATSSARRLSIGAPGLDALLGGGLLERSVTLVSGSAGIGKSTLGMQFVLAGAARRERTVFVSLEESPEQLVRSAAGLGLPLRKAVKDGRVDVVYLSRERALAPQFLAILEERLAARRATRLVLDGASQMLTHGIPQEELRQLLNGLVVRFKDLGVTSLFTLEAKSMVDTGSITDLDLSPVADNIVMMRYRTEQAKLEPMLTVVKTRGSNHVSGAHAFRIGRGGLHVDQEVGAAPRRRDGPGGKRGPKRK